MKNLKANVEKLLKDVRVKKDLVEILDNIDIKQLTNEGKTILQYLKDCFAPSELRDWKLSDMKREILTLMDEKSFVDMNNSLAIMENAKKLAKKKNDDVKEVPSTEVTDEEVDKLMNAVEKKQGNKADNKKPSQQDIIELVGYRYTYPKFPLKFETPLFKDYVFEAVTTENLDDVQEMFDLVLRGEADFEDLVVVTYFPEYERDYDIDPHGVLSERTTRKQLLKKYNGNYPNNLDIQTTVHVDAKARVLVSVSQYTGIPYVTSCQPKWFAVNETLQCRVSQNGLDYQIYKKIAK